MNRRSFFARMLGAACLAVAERVLPSSIGAVKPQSIESPRWAFRDIGGHSQYVDRLNNLPESLRKAMICGEWHRLA